MNLLLVFSDFNLLSIKERKKTGEVAIGKRVETESAQVAVPIEKERVVIERTDATEEKVVAPDTAEQSKKTKL